MAQQGPWQREATGWVNLAAPARPRAARHGPGLGVCSSSEARFPCRTFAGTGARDVRPHRHGEPGRPGAGHPLGRGWKNSGRELLEETRGVSGLWIGAGNRIRTGDPQLGNGFHRKSYHVQGCATLCNPGGSGLGRRPAVPRKPAPFRGFCYALACARRSLEKGDVDDKLKPSIEPSGTIPPGKG